MPSSFVHVELNTSNLKEAQTFYSKLFKWKIGAMAGDPSYLGIDTGGVGGGMQLKPVPDAPNMWLPYVSVESVKKTIAAAKKLGASIVLEYQAIGDMGAIGIFMDPSGAPIGLWEMSVPKKKAPAKKKKK